MIPNNNDKSIEKVVDQLCRLDAEKIDEVLGAILVKNSSLLREVRAILQQRISSKKPTLRVVNY